MSIPEIIRKLQDVFDATVSHERLIRLDYEARLSCYMRGASHVLNVTPPMVNDSLLTRKPFNDNKNYFYKIINDL